MQVGATGHSHARFTPGISALSGNIGLMSRLPVILTYLYAKLAHTSMPNSLECMHARLLGSAVVYIY